ncbi:MAG: glyoxalase [Acidimicrobiia bacterium]|nr:glyoxalase [Acidimicrobiia bacterium]
MARVTGIGGVFFRSEDPQAVQEWYVEHLGLSPENPSFVVMSWGDAGGTTIWAPFPADTDYFGSANQWMFNYRVDDLDGLLVEIRYEGVRVMTKPWRTRTGSSAGVGTPRATRSSSGSRHRVGRTPP